MPERGGISVIINGRSGQAAKAETGDEIRSLFARAAADVRLERVQDPLDIAARARQAALRGDLLVAVETGATLGVLPMGTLNHFAKDAGIPQDPEQAVDAIVAGRRRQVDVGDVNGRVFINNSSVGIYPRMVWEREAEQRRGRRKLTAAAIATVRTWRSYRMIVARVALDGSEAVVRTPFVFVGNNEYKAEGFELGGRTTLDTGRLSVFFAPECGRFEILALPVRALMKRLKNGAPFAAYSAGTLTVDVPQSRVSVALDGEIAMMRSPLVYRIRPRALSVIAPG